MCCAEIRSAFNPEILLTVEELGISYAFEETELKRICIIQVAEGITERIKLDQTTGVIRLFENASKTAWGECLLFNGTHVSPVQESSKHAQQRLDMVRKIASRAEVLHLRGNPGHIMSEALHNL